MAHAHFSAPSGASDHVQQPRLDALFWAVGAVIAALTGTAFWLSYEHLHTVAAGHGLAGAAARSWAWPACLDAFIVVGELLMLRAAWRRTGTDWWAVGLTITGSGGSIALNVFGVGTHAQTLDYVVAGVPPTAALLAFGVFMRQLLLALTGTAVLPVPHAAPPVPAAVPEPLGQFGPREPLPPMRAFVWQPQHPVLATAAVPAPPSGTAPVPDTTGTGGRVTVPVPAALDGQARRAFDDHVRSAIGWLQQNPTLSGAAIGERLGTGDSYGRRVKRAAKGEA